MEFYLITRAFSFRIDFLAPTGIETAHFIRENTIASVVFLTAHTDADTLERAKLTEPHGYLIKPFDMTELKTTVEIALYKNQAEQQRYLLVQQLQHEIEVRKRTEEQLLIKQQAIDSSINAIALASLDGCLTYVNSAFLSMWGYNNKDEVLGRNIVTFWEHETAARQVIATLFAQNNQIGELTAKRKNGSIFFAQLTVSLVRNKTQQPICLMGSFLNITEQKEAENTLREYATELEARNRELDAFAHTVAHDIKNPLGIVLGHTNLLSEYRTSMSEMEMVASLSQINKSTLKASQIIDDLLILAKVDQADVTIAALDMADIVVRAQESLVRLILDRDAKIVTPDTWPIAAGYDPWVELVWTNLISNAIKYGGRPPVVEVGATVMADNTIRFWVHDNGNGILPEDQELLFKPFTRLARSKVPGHGLGLSIVHRIVNKLGGETGVESEIGLGSRFYFTLPDMSDLSLPPDMIGQSESYERVPIIPEFV